MMVAQTIAGPRVRKQAFLCALAMAMLISGSLAQVQEKSTSPSTADRPNLVVQIGGSSSAVAYSPDGRFILTGGNSDSVLWRAESGKEIRRFKGNTRTFTFSPDGQFILAGTGSGEAHLLDVATGKELQYYSLKPRALNSVAFSPDGQQILTGCDDGTVILWTVATGEIVRQFKGKLNEVVYVAFSQDGQSIYACMRSRPRLNGYYSDYTAIVWEAATGKEVKSLSGRDMLSAESYSPLIIFSPDGRYILVGGERSAYLREIETGRIIRGFPTAAIVRAVAFSKDGKFVLALASGGKVWDTETGEEVGRGGDLSVLGGDCGAFSPNNQFIVTGGNAIWLFDTKTRQIVRGFRGEASVGKSLAVSPDGRFILTGGPTANLWDLTTGREIRRFKKEYDGASHVAFSPDGSRVLTSSGFSIYLWDTTRGNEIRQINGRLEEDKSDIEHMEAVAFSPDGKYVATAAGEIFDSKKHNTAVLWDVATGQEVRRFRGHASRIISIAYSPDGKFVLTGSQDETARLWNAATGEEVRQFKGANDFIQAVAFSPDGKFVLTGGNFTDRTLRLWDISSGAEIRRFAGHTSQISSVTFSRDGKTILSAGADNTARLWETATGIELRRFSHQAAYVWDAKFSADGRFILTTSLGVLRIIGASTGEELCRLVSFDNGDWAVVDSDGRFDTNNLDNINGLHWVMPDDPLRTIPLQIFMRDYYEPRLLQRILNGEQLKPVRKLTQLNRVRPDIQIVGIEQQKNNPELVTVTVEVAKANGEYIQGNKKVKRETGVYDVRLFRDGRLVGQMPQPTIGVNRGDSSEELTAWRQTTEINLEANGKRQIRFENIKLPRTINDSKVEISAYAFNEDRVKSETVIKEFAVPKISEPVKGKAFVMSVGVNKHQNPAWNLKFAANDARLAQKTFSNALEKSGEYEQVFDITLVSDSQQETTKPATKANFKEALSQLAAEVRPEDLLIIYFSGHGYADAKGNFYLFPADFGAGTGKQISDAMLARCISSEELSAWLRNVDAGDILMVIDACQSSAAWEREGFKPGPMGSRGLGQLAYDKGMRILAATEADDVALEINQLRHGLLTYALISDGIEARKADFLPKDGKLTLNESLAYCLERVPKLYEAIIKKELPKLFREEGGRGPTVTGEQQSLKSRSAYQKPSLFDFVRKKRDITLAR